MDSSHPLRISTIGSFVALYFSLKNGTVEIEIHDDEAFCKYKDHSGENVKNTKFYQRYLSDAMSHESLYIALKEIRDFDRQHMNEAMSSNMSLDRASFGLAEVN
jgi:predicted restriction endonuclease